MAKIILLLAVGLVCYLLWQQYQRQPPELRRKALIRGGFYTLFGIILLLVVTGRVHWLLAAATAALPLLKLLFGLALRAWPFLQALRRKNQPPPQQQQASAGSSGELSQQEAFQLLGLQPGASRQAIIDAHKRLIQKLHPDRGGNDYLASKLNAARDLLLKLHS
ncbi:molecular chaperone DnaJ [Porticoccus sp.]|uniref:molecular chaperone DnaJ n=1 Tax=Porticoccus sp. TaxID=2024853 RepID=UPI003F69690E